MPEETKVKRTRVKRAYYIETYEEEVGGWRESSGPHTDLRAALADLKHAAPGRFRIIAVCWSGEVKTETKTVTRLEATP